MQDRLLLLQEFPKRNIRDHRDPDLTHEVIKIEDRVLVHIPILLDPDASDVVKDVMADPFVLAHRKRCVVRDEIELGDLRTELTQAKL